MKRINVIGTSGSGKSTFSRVLANILDVEYIEIDKVYWKRDWEEPDDNEFFPKLKNAISGESWVLDGNYKRTTPIKWGNADTVIWLDYGFPRTFWQIFSRSVNRGFKRQELWPDTGNRESLFRTFFTKDSMLLWVLKTYRKNRKKYREIFESNEFDHINFIHINSPKNAKAFIRNLSVI